MKFNIEGLRIKNFKGLRDQDIEFDQIETTICGENGTGKTTVVDAFNWLLFEKDSKGRKQFEIKTLDDGKVIHGLDHLVEGKFKIDGRDLKLKKIYKEIWTLRKGDTQETFTGHEVERFVNDVPVKKMEYEKKINELIDENIFQLLTDPLYFSQSLHWKDRRKTLFELAGEEITKEQIIKDNPSLRFIEEDLEDKTIEELRQALKYQRKELNKEREHIPVRINTLNETIKEVDRTTIDMRIRAVKGSLKNIEDQMLDATKMSEGKLEKQDKLYELKSKQKEIEYELKSNIKDPDEKLKEEIREIQTSIRENEPELRSANKEAERLNGSIAREEKELEELRADYKMEAAKEIEVGEDIKECPTCKRAFSEDDIQQKVKELEENFKGYQVKELKRLRDKGTKLSEDVAAKKENLKELQEQIESVEGKINKYKEELETKQKQIGNTPTESLQDLLAENKEYQETRTGIEKLTAELQNETPESQIENLRLKKTELENELRELEKQIHQEEINKETKEKIDELMVKEKELSDEINKIEKKENIADEYITTQAKLIEKNINEKFKEVSFRLFKKQTNGGLDPTCEVLVEGVPFDNANTAGQVNAGLDVINSLCKHYETYTPIFIDNRESINDLIETDSQLINLKVTRHKTLRIEQK